jgi:hypothetical protein
MYAIGLPLKHACLKKVFDYLIFRECIDRYSVHCLGSSGLDVSAASSIPFPPNLPSYGIVS